MRDQFKNGTVIFMVKLAFSCLIFGVIESLPMECSKVIGEAVVKGKAHPEIQDSKLLWKKTPIPAEAEKYYNMSRLAVELNEMEEGVCPTDSRRRPDQRLMEEGRWDEANTEKVRLEEKQREVRKRREAEQELASLQAYFDVDESKEGCICVHTTALPTILATWRTPGAMRALERQLGPHRCARAAAPRPHPAPKAARRGAQGAALGDHGDTVKQMRAEASRAARAWLFSLPHFTSSGGFLLL